MTPHRSVLFTVLKLHKAGKCTRIEAVEMIEAFFSPLCRSVNHDGGGTEHTSGNRGATWKAAGDSESVNASRSSDQPARK